MVMHIFAIFLISSVFHYIHSLECAQLSGGNSEDFSIQIEHIFWVRASTTVRPTTYLACLFTHDLLCYCCSSHIFT